MSDIVPIISASPPPLDDNFDGFDHWAEEDYDEGFWKAPALPSAAASTNGETFDESILSTKADNSIVNCSQNSKAPLADRSDECVQSSDSLPSSASSEGSTQCTETTNRSSVADSGICSNDASPVTKLKELQQYNDTPAADCRGGPFAEVGDGETDEAICRRSPQNADLEFRDAGDVVDLSPGDQAEVNGGSTIDFRDKDDCCTERSETIASDREIPLDTPSGELIDRPGAPGDSEAATVGGRAALGTAAIADSAAATTIHSTHDEPPTDCLGISAVDDVVDDVADVSSDGLPAPPVDATICACSDSSVTENSDCLTAAAIAENSDCLTAAAVTGNSDCLTAAAVTGNSDCLTAAAVTENSDCLTAAGRAADTQAEAVPNTADTFHIEDDRGGGGGGGGKNATEPVAGDVSSTDATAVQSTACDRTSANQVTVSRPSPTPGEDRCSDGDDDDEDEFAEFSEFSAVDPGTALLASKSDSSWGAFSSTPSDDDDDDGASVTGDWATFQEAQTMCDADDDVNDLEDDSNDLDDDFGDFEHGSSAFKLAEDATIRLSTNMSTALLACFPHLSGADQCDDVMDDLLLLMMSRDDEVKANRSMADINVWHNLKDVHGTIALQYHWSDSTNQGQLIKAIGIDLSNMLYHPWKPGMPAFASGLGMLEPSRSGDVRTAPPSEPVIVDTSATGDSDGSSQDIPPVEFDWNSSGLTNPLDALQKEQEILEAIDVSAAARPVGLPPLENVLAGMKFVPTTTTAAVASGNRRQEEGLDAQVVRALGTLPDLSFMTANGLMFPIRGDTN